MAVKFWDWIEYILPVNLKYTIYFLSKASAASARKCSIKFNIVW